MARRTDDRFVSSVRRAPLRRWYFCVLLVCAALGFAQTGPTEEILKRAIALHQQGRTDDAIEAYRSYLTKHPDSVLALANLGAAYARTGRYQEAILQYQHALKVDPGYAGAQLNLGLAYYKTGQVDAAAVEFEKLHRAAPGELQPVLLLADCRLSMGENQTVIELLEPFANSRPDDLAIAYMLGTALIRDEQTARGQAVIDRILRHGDSAETWLLLGTAKLNARDFPGALGDLKKAVDLKPELPDAWAYYGQALLRTGDPTTATDAYRKALAANPYSFAANMQMAILLKEADDIPGALECLRRAQRARPKDLGLRYQFASIALHDGKLESARSNLEQIVKESPAYTEAHVALATVYYRLKRKEDGDRERDIVQKLIAEAQRKQQQGVNVK
jgi:tetratricopeptide (TPR) repeat protein